MTDEITDSTSLLDAMSKSERQQSSTTPFLSSIEVNRMFIEPEDHIYDKPYNRNLQMGFIERMDQPIQQMKWESAKLLADVPPSQGMFLFSWMAGINIDSVNFKFVSSNSVDGKGRMSMLTRVVRQIQKDETQKSSVSNFFGSSDNKSQ